MLLVALVPVVGPMLAGISVYRLLSLPRRTWPPRPDEADRVVGVPDDPGAYLLLPTFAAAEALRTAWCDNLHHEHPYPSWRVARQRLHSR